MLRNKFLLLGQRLIERNPWYLAPISWIYGFVVFLRNAFFDLGLLPVAKVEAVVVSVGNIVAGGSGKTPFVLLLAQQFPHRKIAILSRGYGAMPDEAMLLAKRLPNVQVLVGKNRAQLAKQTDADLIIMDDGFQHRWLHRDFDLVLGDTEGHYLPWGFLRDSPKRVKKACHFSGKLAVKRILDQKGNEIASIRGWKVAIFCGIAKPENFKKTVAALGAEIIGEKILADHEPVQLSELPKADAFLCTEKDFVKLPPTNLPIYYLEMEMEIDSLSQWNELIAEIENKW